MRIDGTDKPESWEAIYQAGDAGWDINKPAPPFVDLLKSKPSWLNSEGKIICFGAGKGHDSNFFAENGFQVTAVDFAPSAIDAINEYSKENTNLKALKADILELAKEHQGAYNYVLEHTCFCAIPVENRAKYVDAVKTALKPDGILFGLFYRFDPIDEKGPPYCTSEDEIRKLFEKDFEIFLWETPKTSHGKRKNRERLIAMRIKK